MNCPGCGDELDEGRIVCDDCMAEVMEGEGEEEFEQEEFEEFE